MSIRTKPEQAKTKVFLVDDHPLVRELLSQLIQRENDMEVCGEAEDAHEAVSKIEQSRPDIVIADISLKTTHGLELVKDLQVRWPSLPVLMLSMHDEAVFAERVLRAGGRGYVSKQAGADKLAEAIRHVLSGQIYVSATVSTRLLDGLSGEHPGRVASPVEKLTDRELEVFTLIGQAIETKEIARRLNMSSKTVEAHRGAIKRKLKLKTGPELMRHAVLWVEATR
jgi:DNA-binding NarL/FixJ family response regulator